MGLGFCRFHRLRARRLLLGDSGRLRLPKWYQNVVQGKHQVLYCSSFRKVVAQMVIDNQGLGVKGIDDRWARATALIDDDDVSRLICFHRLSLLLIMYASALCDEVNIY